MNMPDPDAKTVCIRILNDTVNDLATRYGVEPVAMALAEIIARNAPLGIQVTKEAGRKFIEAGEQAAIAIIPQIRERVLNTADAAEGIKSFVERRAAVFQGR